MAIEPIVAVSLGFLVGGAAGAFSAYLGWNRSGEEFIPRKFIDGLATGVITGVMLVFANLMAFKEITDDFAFIALLGTIFAGAIGLDAVREGVSGSLPSAKKKAQSLADNTAAPI